MTAFKNLPPWDDFQKGQDSLMLRMRKRFTGMLDRMHLQTMRKFSPFSPQKTRIWPTRAGGKVVGVDCGLARPRFTVQLNPSLDGLDDGHRPWIDLATGRTPPSMVRRRQLSAVYGQLHHAALVSVGDVLAAFCVPGPRHLSRWSLGFLPETVGLMRSCIVLVRQW